MSSRPMHTTENFDKKRQQADQQHIKDEWIRHIYRYPEYQQRQKDGRISLYGRVEQMANRYLRIVLLRDGKTVKDAYFVDNFHRVSSGGSWSKLVDGRVKDNSARGRRLRTV